MKIVAYAALVALLVCSSASGAEPYTYRLMQKQDHSLYNAIYRLYLNTQTVPDRDRMKATAQQVWQDGNRRWHEFTVFMIFGQIKDFNAGAYGIAEFTPDGLSSFSINDVPLMMLEIEGNTEPQSTVHPEPSAATARIDPQKLRIGQAFFVSRRTPLMPEADPVDAWAALERLEYEPIKYIPTGGAFNIQEIRKKRPSSDPWYRVVATDRAKKQIGSGWINSGALLGQDLKPYK